MRPNPKRKAIAELILLALAIALFFAWIYFKNQPTGDAGDVLVYTATTTAHVVTFPDVSIQAQEAYVYDTVTKKPLYAKDAYEPLPLASLTKLMSTLVARRTIPDYVEIPITLKDIEEDGDNGLLVGEKWKFRDLLDFTLITSSNDGIRAIAKEGGLEISSTSTDPLATFIGRMNETAQSLGLRSMRFYDQSGLDLSTTTSGGYGSAHDVAMLVDYLFSHYPHLLEATTYSNETLSSDSAVHVAKNTDIAIPDIPNMIASKTGYTDLAGGNLVVAFNAGLNHPVIISLLGSTYEGRFSDMKALVDATLVYLREKASSSTPPYR